MLSHLSVYFYLRPSGFKTCSISQLYNKFGYQPLKCRKIYSYLLSPSFSVGKLDVDKWLKNNSVESPRNLTGGPQGCSPRHAVAIIIPYRDREKQLATLLTYLPPILDRQQLSYRIFVVEQVPQSLS